MASAKTPAPVTPAPMTPAPAPPETPAPVAPTLREITRVFGRIGVLSFGGPAAQIALMHRELVEARPWLSERQFLNALSFCMLLPGPEAMQLATYAGWRLRGTVGGLVAGLLFVGPGAMVVLLLATLYAGFGTLPGVQALFLGIKAAVVVIVLQALWTVAARALSGVLPHAIAGGAFAAISVFGLPFPAIIAGAALLGSVFLQRPGEEGPAPEVRVSGRDTGRTVAFWAAIWLVPLAAVVLLAPGGVLAEVGVFFAKLALVTFGGAYAVLAYMVQAVVDDLGWLSVAQMMDALGLAETTPGPLILVTQFVAFLAGAFAGGWFVGAAAALLALWVTFAPCFLWIFAGAPYLEWIASRPRLIGALSGITAAVVGVIASLSLWFAGHVLFAAQSAVSLPFADLSLPVLRSLDPLALGLCVLAAGMVMGLRMDLLKVLPIMAGAGWLAVGATGGI